ncbi:hypothetical protein COO09_08605 [Rhizorhabdus dicambivorans]|uniref:Uncharacterized protein n=2 Tax=Rhizorhabdus dicambivorans TaxID=1850238 RepID=A0A2A4FXF5_9SPHN|nr:hypothetical protein [Rhizorhabdus dicambivorans]PCE42870.1 hypothetical protein COO09_08605 [Rhizorhabdus dicambivorans]
MMHWFKALAAAALLAVAAGPAQAADWWLVPARPGAQAVMFADVETLQRQGGVVSLRVLRIDRAGRSGERVERIRCDGAQMDFPLHRFACASGAERERYGLILAGMPPDEAARMVFAIPARPRS